MAKCKATKGERKQAAEAIAAKPKRGEPRPCECECGALTKGGRFRPGHDAKLASRLLAAKRAAEGEGK
jgi:hypothetical protein